VQNNIPTNNQIKAKEVRVVDETGKQLGILALSEAIRIAQEKKLDLIQVTERVVPPVCKIGDFGKYLYSQKKKERSIKQKGGELKGIRLTFAISEHDLEMRAHQAEKFLKEGDVIRVEMRLRGRERSLGDFAKNKMRKFIEILEKLTPTKIEKEIKREPRSLTMMISARSKKEATSKQ